MFTESARNLHKIIEAHITLAALDPANVGRVQASTMGQVFLGPAFRRPKFANCAAQADSVRTSHRLETSEKQTISLETISIVVAWAFLHARIRAVH